MARVLASIKQESPEDRALRIAPIMTTATDKELFQAMQLDVPGMTDLWSDAGCSALQPLKRTANMQ